MLTHAADGGWGTGDPASAGPGPHLFDRCAAGSTPHPPARGGFRCAQHRAGAPLCKGGGLRDVSIGVTGSLAANGIWEGIRYAIGAD